MIKNLISLIKQFRRLVFFRHTSLAAQSASVTYYIYAPSPRSPLPRLTKKYGALTFYIQI